jgi:hypothetical protein
MFLKNIGNYLDSLIKGHELRILHSFHALCSGNAFNSVLILYLLEM